MRRWIAFYIAFTGLFAGATTNSALNGHWQIQGETQPYGFDRIFVGKKMVIAGTTEFPFGAEKVVESAPEEGDGFWNGKSIGSCSLTTRRAVVAGNKIVLIEAHRLAPRAPNVLGALNCYFMPSLEGAAPPHVFYRYVLETPGDIGLMTLRGVFQGDDRDRPDLTSEQLAAPDLILSTSRSVSITGQYTPISK